MIESSIFGMDPFIFHFNNLLLHIVNSILLFYLFMLLLQKVRIDKKHIRIAAFLGALLFCMHPFKVESVAWAVERKDVLFSFFYLLGLIVYTRYVNKKEGKFLWLAVLCYALTLLSKSMGITFLAILFLVDYLSKREMNSQLIREKIPFAVLAFIALFVYGMFTRYDKVTLGITEGLLNEEADSDPT